MSPRSDTVKPLWQLSSHQLSQRDRQQRWGALGLMTAPLIGAPLYNLGWWIPGFVCPLRHWTGVPCPTCGLTRSLMAVVRGDWSQAVMHHLFGPLLFLVLLVGIIQFAIELRSGRKLHAFYSPWIQQWGRDRRYALSALAALLIYHALRLSYLASTGRLQQDFWLSPLGQAFTH